jgi:YaiO family outer membrane protein
MNSTAKTYKLVIVVPLFLFLLIAPLNSYAQQYQNRIEGELTYEHFKPSSTYDSRFSAFGRFSKFPTPLWNYSIGLGYFNWVNNNDLLATANLTKDWSRRFYTISAFSLGTNSDYLPQLRLDNEFNFKLGSRLAFVFTTGISYIKYHTKNEDLILSLGGTYYFSRLNLSYRYFSNRSNPGSVTSDGHLISAGYGREQNRWTYLTVSFGSQAYLAQYLPNPEESRNDVIRFALNHRHWLNKKSGLYADLSYLDLDSGYEIYGIMLGYFYEF